MINKWKPITAPAVDPEAMGGQPEENALKKAIRNSPGLIANYNSLKQYYEGQHNQARALEVEYARDLATEDYVAFVGNQLDGNQDTIRIYNRNQPCHA